MKVQIQAWNKRTKQFQTIPDHWLDHPILGGDFLREKPADKPKPTKAAAQASAKSADATSDKEKK